MGHPKDQKPKLHCIHGNLQTPEVWEPFQVSFKCQGQQFTLECEDLHQSSAKGFRNWTKAFCQKVETNSSGSKPFLLGYSLGGRLALQACLWKPELWSGVVIIAADTGLTDPEEKQRQLKQDQHWGTRFTTEDLQSLFDEWDALPVFTHIPNQAPRKLSHFEPEYIQQIFDHFSKGRQENLLPALTKLAEPPLLYLSGEWDDKYTKIGQHLEQQCPALQHRIISKAGHRVPWENPMDFVKVVQEFLELTLKKQRQEE